MIPPNVKTLLSVFIMATVTTMSLGTSFSTSDRVTFNKLTDRITESSIGKFATAAIAPQTTTAFEFIALKTTVAVWADDHGDIILEQRIRNIDSAPISEFSWGFNFGQTQYEPILAWDDTGELRHQVESTDTGIRVIAYLRQPLLQDQDYKFSVSVSTADMTETTGNNGLAHWTVSPGARVESHIHGVTFPLSSSIESVTPQPDSSVQSYREWRRSDTDSALEINVSYRMRDDIPGIPSLLQGDTRWGDNTWYTYPPNTAGETIRKWGCNLTSAVMLINYYAAATGSSSRTTPGDLNDWIRSNGIKSVSAIYPQALSYAKELGVELFMPDNAFLAPSASTSERLQTYLRTGNPVILRVNAASASGVHFVVATGITTFNGRETYTINDPVYGQTTVAERYPGGYTQVNLFNSTSPDRRTLMTIIHSPAELLVTDPQGRRTGKNPITGEEFNEIPGAVYVYNNIAPNTDNSKDEPLDEKYVFVPSPLDGEYKVSVIGIDTGGYLVENVATDWDGGISSAQFSGSTAEGQIDEQIVQYDGVLGVVKQQYYFPAIRR